LATSVDIPIRINQTEPILIELLRYDFETNQNETLVITSKEASRLVKKAKNATPKNERTENQALDLRYALKKTGIYRLQKVIDKSNLEVQRRASDAMVVTCPTAQVRVSRPHKCNGELSDLVLDVRGTPPLKIRYSRAINDNDRSSSLQSVQPENFISPLIRQSASGPLVDPRNPDFTWARARSVPVPLNESLRIGGLWSYTIEEVHDAVGNIVNYTMHHEASHNPRLQAGPQHQEFTVHDRPKIAFRGCDSQNPLLVAKNRDITIPISLQSTGKPLEWDMPVKVGYSFSSMGSDEEGVKERRTTMEEIVLKDGVSPPTIRDAGWYDLRSVSTRFCDGEVLEPASCLLQNPQEPDLSITSKDIFDECAGNSVGLEVDLSMVGTPPFRVQYIVRHDGKGLPAAKYVESLRDQLQLVPNEAGRYNYEFTEISDKFYQSVPLQWKGLKLEQDVKPLASARFRHGYLRRHACIQEPLSFDVDLSGEGPWKVQYEIVHRGKRTRHEVDIDASPYTLVTDKLKLGGEYSLALTGIQDKSGCKRTLNEEVKFDVRHDRPAASFGFIDGKRTVSALDHRTVKLPLRLKGEAPWTIYYMHGNSSAPLVESIIYDGNGYLTVDKDGRYEIEQVHDVSCPGSADKSGNVFQVNWIPRPTIQLADTTGANVGKKITRLDICEGDDDVLDVKLTGTPPYRVKYEQHLSPLSGSASVSVKEFSAALGTSSIRMDTSKAGTYEYKVVELSDNLYNHDRPAFSPLVVHQTVHPRPSASFAKPGTTYAYCKEEADGDEVIPIKLIGQPPFSLEVSIKHHAQAKSEIVTIPKITTNEYNYRIPRQHLDLGPHTVSVHKVQDGHSCQQWYDTKKVSSVRVLVSDVPTISPTESRTDFCVGERISYVLSGLPPFEVFYTFEGRARKAVSSATSFKRIAEKPGEFTITGVSDGASGKCKANTEIKKIIHGMPSVRISKGKDSTVDIHEGGEADIQFDFGGTPPFHFT
jgi:nucleoporin POM152